MRRRAGASAPRCGSRGQRRAAAAPRACRPRNGGRCGCPTVGAAELVEGDVVPACADAHRGGPGQARGAVGAGALRGRALRVGRGDAVGRGLLRAGADHLRRARTGRCRVTPRSRWRSARRSSSTPSRPGDLLFFRGETGDRITHVAFAAADDTLIHSTVACGGVLMRVVAAGHPRGRRCASGWSRFGGWRTR